MQYLNLCGYAAIPLAFASHWIGHGHGWEPGVTFSLAALGVVPLAHLMGTSTEHLSDKTGPTWGGLLNATFGNAAELIIAIIGLSKGMNDVVKASLTGSILGNLLLVGGAAMLVGGWNREKQSFSAAAAESNAGLLMLAIAAMLMPAIFHFTYSQHDPKLHEHETALSVGTSFILLIVYGLGLLFSLRTHAHLFCLDPARESSKTPKDAPELPAWTIRRSVTMLLLASIGIALVAELLVGSAQAVADTLHWNPIFVGVILLAIIGNAAEHSTALMLARRNDMQTAMTITYQSSVQIALFVTPLLVFISAIMVATGATHAHRLDLIFSPMEVVAVFITAMIVIVLSLNGETNWLEGVLLLAVYVILGIAFFYIPTGLPGR